MKNIVEAWKIRFKSTYHIAALILISSAAAAAFYLTGDNNHNAHILQQLPTRQQELTTPYAENIKDAAAGSSCNLFAGKWVYDDVSYPLYKEEQCSFMRFEFAREQYACQINGRKDFEYQKWRWQPHDCDLPRFNGTALLEKIRGKRVVFVGDSLNRNQWTSMLCLIDSSLHQSSDKSLTYKANLAIFKSIEYNATIEMYWSPLLVESNCDDQFNHHSIRDRIIKIRAIEKHARQWNDAHILIFDTFMWWLEPTMTLLWGSFESPDAIYKRVEMKLRRYEMALNTWSDWVEMNINRTKTKLFFMSQSPFHSRGESWDMIQSCYNESEPNMKEGYRGITTDVEMMRIAESVIKKLETRGVKVEYLNITQLSDYRRDSHPSIYRTFNSPLSEEQLANPKSYADCMHWCLPGLPDTWNQILYSYIINS
ncbi:hypothetical protein ACS0TY_011922 [Phlomoides rotata]